jgi:hypothetical protein
MGLKRRAFLQRTSFALAALGLSEAGLSLLANRYYQTLAQSQARKLALLIGINQYPEGFDGHFPALTPALSGCVTDVELQRELLIHRFGFHADDIVTLTDAQATRQNIEAAFLSHLQEQARADDIVVFHFSGYGSRIDLSASLPTRGSEIKSGPATFLGDVQNSLVPVDSMLSTDENSTVNDLLEETLLLLLRSLQTDRITTVLDTSYIPPRTAPQGNLRIRTRLTRPTAGQLSQDQLALQEELLQKVKASREEAKVRRRFGQMPGVVLAAATSNQGKADPTSGMAMPGEKAFEAQWNGFSAGLFTYALTQYLWWATPATSLQVSMGRAASMVEQLVGREQQPKLSGHSSREQTLLADNFTPGSGTEADGAVIAVEENGRAGQLWLAGLPIKVLEHYVANSLMAVGSPSDPLLLQIRSRNGLTALVKVLGSKTEITSPLQVGQLVQEAVRVLPRHIDLTVALDPGLERIERVDATSAFAATPHVSLVVTVDQPADYLLGRVQDTVSTAALLPIPEASSPTIPVALQAANGELSVPHVSYGLFSLSRVLISTTVGEPGEAVKTAVHRLTPQLRTLLAAKLLRLTANEGSSRLGVRVTLERIAPQEQVLMQRETVRAPGSVASTSPSAQLVGKDAVLTLPIGSRIRYRLHNYSDRPIYFIVLGLDSSSSAIALYAKTSLQDPNGTQTKPMLQNERLAPGETISVPQTSGSSEWIIQGPDGLAEIQLICSSAPFTKTLASLEGAVRPTGNSQQIGVLSNPLEVSRAVLEDLHQASIGSGQLAGTSSDTWALDVNAWATFSFIYRVTEGRSPIIQSVAPGTLS